ncbi:MAG: hypothetical protein NC191_03740 [Muribaculaceae bacterium]|nr:hypothetical protein [Muribaculaceae bacterium]
MKEKIIIDSVDISECKHLHQFTNDNDKYCSATFPLYKTCASIKDCSYKLLACKTEECDRYKQALDEKNDFLQKSGISASGEFKRIDYYLSQQNQQVEKYKQALEEVKHWAYLGRCAKKKKEHLEHIFELCREVLND